MSIDLASIENIASSFDEGVEIDVKHPITEEPLGIKMQVASYDSDRVKKVERRQADATIDAQLRRKRTNADRLLRNAREIQAAAIITWTPFKVDGEEWVYSSARALEFVTRFPLLAEQIDEVAGNRRAFFRGTDG